MSDETTKQEENLATTVQIQKEQFDRLDIKRQATSPSNPRQDKAVTAFPKNQTVGNQVSSIFIGKSPEQKQQGMQLKDGTYINKEELRIALQNELEKQTKDNQKIIVSKKGTKISISELLELLNSFTEIILTNGSTKIRTPNHHLSIKIGKTNKTYSKGLSFGYKDKTLPNGTYINLNDVIAALSEYMLVTKKEKKPPVTPPVKPSEEQKNYVVRVKKKYKNKAARWIIALGITATLLSGLRLKNITEKQIKRTEHPITTITQINEQDLKYVIKYLKSYNFSDEEIQQILYKNINMGDEVEIPKGLELYKSSRLDETTGTITIGEEPFKEGKYKITGFSIIYNNEMIEFIEAYNNENITKNLKQFIDETLKKHNLTIDDIEIRLHVGEGQTRAGWFDISELVKGEQIKSETIEKTAKESATITGEIANFEGDTITITTDHGEVKIPIKDENGNFYKENTKVKGSDGQEYTISVLDVKDITKTTQTTTTETITEEKEVVTGKKITWKIVDCKKEIIIISLLTALASQLLIDRQNRTTKAVFEQMDDEAAYIKFKNDFIKLMEEYNEKKSFTKKLQEIFLRKRIDTMQPLTEEDIKQIFKIIKQLKEYKNGYEIIFKDGKIILKKEERQTDITDLIINVIQKIGSKNPVDATGLTELIDSEEIAREIRKK